MGLTLHRGFESRPLRFVNSRGLLVQVITVAAFSLAAIGGAYLYSENDKKGEDATATVTDCTVRPAKVGGTRCRGTWVQGGSLLEGGHVVRGLIEGVGKGSEGKEFHVHVRGDVAHVPSKRIPIILVVVGVAIALFGGYRIARDWRRAAA